MAKPLLFLLFFLFIPIVSAQAGFSDLLGQLTDQDKNFDNGICDAAENWPFDTDCALSQEDVTTGEVFGLAWVLRLFILLSVFFIISNHGYGTFFVIVTFGIAVFQGAFGIVEKTSLTSVGCNVGDLGACLFPNSPTLGWVLWALIIIIIYRIMRKGKGDGRQ